MGAFFGPIPVALEPRIKVAVFASGGLRFNFPPEIQPANFMPRVKIPVLLVNGRDDFRSPTIISGVSSNCSGHAGDRSVTLRSNGGHVPTDQRGVIREVLDWFDKYLGAVK